MTLTLTPLEIWEGEAIVTITRPRRENPDMIDCDVAEAKKIEKNSKLLENNKLLLICLAC